MSKSSLVAAGAAVVLALAVILGYAYFTGSEATRVKVGHTAPDLYLPMVHSDLLVKLSNFRGRPVLLAMFLSECEICQREVRQIEALHRRYVGKGLMVIGVSVDPNREAATVFASRHQLSFPVLLDVEGASVREAYGSWKFPETYLIDATGRVAAVYLGSVLWGAREVQQRIESVLPPATPPSRGQPGAPAGPPGS